MEPDLKTLPKPMQAAAMRSSGRRPSSHDLRQVAVLFGVPDAKMARLAGRMRLKVVSSGQDVVSQDEQTNGAVYFVLSGRLSVTLMSRDGEVFRLQDLCSGDMFGEMSALDNTPRSANVAALTASSLAVMDRPDFINAVTESPIFSLRIMCLLAQRTRRLNTLMLERETLDVSQRVAAELARRMAPTASRSPQVIDPAPRQLDIAQIIGARRESVAREFGRLQRAGILSRDGRRLVIIKPDALIRLAEANNG